MATKERERDDGGRDLLEVDIYEVSVTPSPMNNRTRILSVKSAETIESRLTEEELATYERLRAEWRADRAAKAEAKEEEEAEAWQRAIMNTPRRRTRIAFTGTSWQEVDEEPEEQPISVCGVQVLPSNITFNGR